MEYNNPLKQYKDLYLHQLDYWLFEYYQASDNLIKAKEQKDIICLTYQVNHLESVIKDSLVKVNLSIDQQ